MHDESLPHRPVLIPLAFAAAGATLALLLPGNRRSTGGAAVRAAAGGLAGAAAWLLWQRTAGRPTPATQALVPVTPADAPLGIPGANLDQRLDEAIEESFPASDPISLHIE